MPLSKITGNSFSTSANTNVDNGTFFVDVTNNRVGVGLANPTQTLDVARKFTVDTTNTFGKVTLARYTDSSLSSYLQGTDATGLANGLYLAYGGGSAQGIAFDGGNIVFYNNTNTTERIRITDAGVLQLANGQIKFPASQQASADANTLDDYEEGTWTPALTFSGSSVGLTYENRAGIYTKVGNLVFYTFGLVVTNLGSSTGTMQVEGLPYAAGGSKSYREDNTRVGRRKGINTDCSTWIQNNNTYMIFLESTTDTTLTKTNLTAPVALFVSGHYFAST